MSSKFRSRKAQGEKLDMLGGEGSNNATGDLSGMTMSDLTATMFGGQMPTVTRQQIQQQNAPLPENAIVIEDDGTLTFNGYALTSVGLIDNPQATFDDWNALGTMLFRLEGSIQWLIGDWLLVGAGRWGSMYDQAVEQFGRANNTLRGYKTMALNFHMSRRREALTFGHHYTVKSLSADVQDYFLDLAEQEQLSVADLRKAIRAWQNQDIEEHQPLLTDDYINAVKRATSVIMNPQTVGTNPGGIITDAERTIEAMDELIRYAQRFLD